MLQGTSPVATLVDFLSIGSGTLSGVRNEEELAEQGGQMTLTGFAQHACRVQGVISELRENIGAEQMQNFVLVSEVVDEVLTLLQTCTICATWGRSAPTCSPSRARSPCRRLRKTALSERRIVVVVFGVMLRGTV